MLFWIYFPWLPEENRVYRTFSELATSAVSCTKSSSIDSPLYYYGKTKMSSTANADNFPKLAIIVKEKENARLPENPELQNLPCENISSIAAQFVYTLENIDVCGILIIVS